ncbi:MAG: SDR family oxidoreductase [Curvibacter sp.]|nr:SDR family oxidoreductase [Curvibacter sp.]
MKRFEGQVALITGGGTGIGAAVAAGFVAEGGRIALMGRRAAPLQSVAEPLGGLVLTGDASVAADVQRGLRTIEEIWGGVDVLVANAGGHGLGNALQTDDASWALATRLNLDTAFVCAREALPGLIRRRGSIVILSSLAGHFAGPDVVGYVTMKHALIGLTRSLARDYGRQGVRVNAVCPGWVRTAMADEQMQALCQRRGLASVDEAYQLVTRDVPLQRPAEAVDVADAVLFLASRQARMVTGTSLLVDGGASAVDLPTLAFVDPKPQQEVSA